MLGPAGVQTDRWTGGVWNGETEWDHNCGTGASSDEECFLMSFHGVMCSGPGRWVHFSIVHGTRQWVV